jgi:hypothetical protein
LNPFFFIEPTLQVGRNENLQLVVLWSLCKGLIDSPSSTSGVAGSGVRDIHWVLESMCVFQVQHLSWDIWLGIWVGSESRFGLLPLFTHHFAFCFLAQHNVDFVQAVKTTFNLHGINCMEGRVRIGTPSMLDGSYTYSFQVGGILKE